MKHFKELSNSLKQIISNPVSLFPHLIMALAFLAYYIYFVQGYNLQIIPSYFLPVTLLLFLIVVFLDGMALSYFKGLQKKKTIRLKDQINSSLKLYTRVLLSKALKTFLFWIPLIFVVYIGLSISIAGFEMIMIGEQGVAEELGLMLILTALIGIPAMLLFIIYGFFVYTLLSYVETYSAEVGFRQSFSNSFNFAKKYTTLFTRSGLIIFLIGSLILALFFFLDIVLPNEVLGITLALLLAIPIWSVYMNYLFRILKVTFK